MDETTKTMGEGEQPIEQETVQAQAEAAKPATQAHETADEAAAPADKPDGAAPDQPTTETGGATGDEPGDMADDTADAAIAAPDASDAALVEKARQLETRLLNSLAETAAIQQGVPAERVKHVLKLAALNGIDVSGEDAAEKVKNAVSSVLDELPELITKPSPGTGSPGAFQRKPVAPEKTPFEKGFEQG